MLEAGTILQGRFLIERVLGQGGMATVYAARHTIITEQRVAIKETVLPSVDSEERQRVINLFNQEAQLLARLEHPALVQVSDFFQEGDSQFLVMTLIEGKTLDHIVGERDDLPPQREVIGWAEQMVDVLSYMHAQQPPVIYRDLKPSNMMIDKNGKLWLLDFGIAREADAGSKTATQLKGFGTPGYAPPEQFGRTSTDARSDIYALGATLYALLTGERPPVSVDLMMNDATLTVPTQLNPEITAPMERAILKMMALKKDDRYQTMVEVREVLRAIPGDARPGADLALRKPSFPGQSGAGSFTSSSIYKRAAGGGGPGASFPSIAGIPAAPRPPAPVAELAPTAEAARPAAPRAPGLVPRRTSPPSTSALPRAAANAASPSIWTPTSADELPEVPVSFQANNTGWVRAVAAVVLCAALALPCVFNRHVPGLTFIPTIIVYPLGHILMQPLPHPLDYLGGMIFQFAIPLGLAAWLSARRQNFWVYVCLFVATQGVVTLGVEVASGAAHGMAFDWKMMLGLTTSAQVMRMGEALRIVGLLAMLSPIWFMLNWLYRNRPAFAPREDPAF